MSLVWSLGVFTYSLVLGKETGLQNCYFAIVAVPFICLCQVNKRLSFYI